MVFPIRKSTHNVPGSSITEWKDDLQIRSGRWEPTLPSHLKADRKSKCRWEVVKRKGGSPAPPITGVSEFRLDW